MILVTGVILIGIRKWLHYTPPCFTQGGFVLSTGMKKPLFFLTVANTASPTLLDPDKFQKEIGKGAMGCLTAHIDERWGCDHLDNILWKIG